MVNPPPKPGVPQRGRIRHGTAPRPAGIPRPRLALCLRPLGSPLPYGTELCRLDRHALAMTAGRNVCMQCWWFS